MVKKSKNSTAPLQFLLPLMTFALIGALLLAISSLIQKPTQPQPSQAQIAIGTKIVFNSNRSGNQEIYTMNRDGTGIVNLSNNPRNDYMPSVSKDGTKIVFTSERDGNAEIYLMNTDGSGLTRLTNNTVGDLGAKFSPDGRTIAFSSTPPSSGGKSRADIYTMSITGANRTNITKVSLTSSAVQLTYGSPSYSPDGTKIVAIKDGLFIYTMNRDGSGKTKVSTGPDLYQPTNPSYSRDGSKILFSARSFKENVGLSIYTVNKLGGTPVKVTQTVWPRTVNGVTSYSYDKAINPAYSPDGTQIVFSYISNFNQPLHSNYHIYVMNSNGTNKTRVIDAPFSINDLNPSIF